MSNLIYDETICYLQHHYKTLDEVASQTNTQKETILDLIAKGFAPKHSYEITTQHNVISCVAAETFSVTTYYYHPDVIGWIEKINELLTSGKNVHRIIYSAFELEFMRALQIPEAKTAYPNYVNLHNEFDLDKITLLIKEKWSEFLSGGYGVCLKHLSATNIVKKDAAVAVLNIILNVNKMHYPATDITRYIAMYNELVQPFAPYELHKSSRKKVNDITSCLAN